MSGILYIVATPIGNLDDISVRVSKVLSEVDIIAAEDTRHSHFMLKKLNISTTLVSCHEHNEQSRLDELLARLKSGKSIALICDAGTPLINDPGYRLVDLAHSEKITVCPVPGPSAVITALSCSGLPTHRFLFEGFLPAKKNSRLKRLQELSRVPYTLVVYESSHRIVDALADMQAVFNPDRLLTIAREMTKKFEHIERLSIGMCLSWIEADSHRQKGEFVLVIEGDDSAGKEREQLSIEGEKIEQFIRNLLVELPLKTVVSMCVDLTGLPKNTIYKMAKQQKIS